MRITDGSSRLAIPLALAAALGTGCDGTPTTPSADGGMLDHVALCDPAGHDWTIDVHHDFFPLPVGQQWVLEGVEEDDEGEEVEVRLRITVLDETEVVAGVTTRVVEEREWEDDELIEVSRNYFARTTDGTLCYLGEGVDIYEDGEIVSHEGAWRAEGPNRAGIFLPADPQVGMVFRQEDAPGAQDLAGIIGIGEEVVVPFGVFDDTVLARDCNPIEEPGCDPLEDGDLKVYVRGVGLVVDGPVELIEFEAGG